VIHGGTLDELAANIAARMEKIRPHIGTVELSRDFAANLEQTFKRFNQYARKGVDPEFKRGATDYDRAWALFFQPPQRGTRWKIESDMPNPAMYPLQEKGPYFALIAGAGALDTNGGPAIDTQGRVLDATGRPIPGLYGAGNCIASPTREAYFGPGGTIGPAMTFGYIAARHASQQADREA
jgi:3-oxosteroid 1-dehydrogenase